MSGGLDIGDEMRQQLGAEHADEVADAIEEFVNGCTIRMKDAHANGGFIEGPRMDRVQVRKVAIQFHVTVDGTPYKYERDFNFRSGG